ncbi:hypothetical protein [Arthrobacter sp. Leaf141]|uniref:hypothetical protein n=1 Tax=Arthrobacter sp. Leaf141 TaxID=1736273 RepID=UPI000AEE5401|nr:hypothetical protein [Arthrobacter sp. Leaf141]
MTRNRTVTGKSLLIAFALSIVLGGAIGLTQGWQYSFIGLGAGLGPLIGAYFGNKKAAEVDAYREEWLGQRKKTNTKPQPPNETS